MLTSPTLPPNPHFEVIDPSRPAGAQIFEALKVSILKMDLEPGAFISESDIGTKFGASRTPVREAFMQLREAGLVTTQPSRGNFVTKLNREKILEARYLREALEVANVGKLCRDGLSMEFRQKLSDNLIHQSEAIKRQNNLDFQRLDDEFHLTMALATGYERAASVLKREKMLLDRLRVLSLNRETHMKNLLWEHQVLLTALIAKDAAKATHTTRKHLSSVMNTLSNLRETHEEYFD
ncbi:MAG: GntR family transcriptional regulator [Hyphomicrobiales bacterium]